MKAFAVGLLILLPSLGCCDRETPRLQSHWLRAMTGHHLTATSLKRDRLEVELVPTNSARGDRFVDERLEGYLFSQHYGFWLDVTNKAERPIRLLWTEARYVDEVGTEHAVYAQPRGTNFPVPSQMKGGPIMVLRPGQRIRPTVFPIYKTSIVVSGCSNYVPFYEPLVPTRLDDKNEEEMKAYVHRLAERRVPFQLVLPIEVDEKRYEYTFTFILRERSGGADATTSR